MMPAQLTGWFSHNTPTAHKTNYQMWQYWTPGHSLHHFYPNWHFQQALLSEVVFQTDILFQISPLQQTQWAVWIYSRHQILKYYFWLKSINLLCKKTATKNSFVQLYFVSRLTPATQLTEFCLLTENLNFCFLDACAILTDGGLTDQQKGQTKLRLKLTSTRGMILVSEGSTFSNSASAGLSGNLIKPKHVST